MADTVTSQTLYNSANRTVRAFTNVSDGTGESAVAKIDISGLTGAPTKIKINRVQYDCNGMAVKVAFDHDTDDTVLVLSGQGCFDFRDCGGLHDPASTGGTGDILFTTIGHAANDTYTVVLDVEWP